MKHPRAIWALLFISLLAPIPSRASLIINATFDSSITSDANSAIIESSILTAIGVFESTYSTNITVPIYFQEGGGLGGSEFYYYTATYSTFYSQLVSKDANPAAIAGLTANGGNSTHNPVNGTTSIDIKSANARALGFNAPAGCIPTLISGTMQCTSGSGSSAVDGIITLNTSITYPPQSDNGSNYGLVSTAEHEIDEVLGLGSSLENTTQTSGDATVLGGNPAPEDLFRYNAAGSRTFAVNCGASAVAAYFSYSGATDLSQFNNAFNGADFADWTTGSYAQVQDAFGTPGTDPAYGSNEIAALSAIGYTVTAPEPGTWALLTASLIALPFARRKSKICERTSVVGSGLRPRRRASAWRRLAAPASAFQRSTNSVKGT